ncbi:hypothetical protein NQZ68_015660 [Dissostichus eleginoides]|nr:hypothetical protein NQZ68_015660 [Dissostichus eleginoides]
MVQIQVGWRGTDEFGPMFFWVCPRPVTMEMRDFLEERFYSRVLDEPKPTKGNKAEPSGDVVCPANTLMGEQPIARKPHQEFLLVRAKLPGPKTTKQP